MYIQPEEESIKECKKGLFDFENISELKVNIDKTEVIKIGGIKIYHDNSLYRSQLNLDN